MRLTTLNLWGLNKWSEREPAIVNHINDIGTDVLLMQENVFLPDQTIHTPVQMLAQHLDLKYRAEGTPRLQKTPENKDYREGLAVLSRYPILASEMISLLKDPRDNCQRLLQLVDIETPEGVLKLANIHLSVTDDYDFATPQLREVMQILRERGEPRTITGDFNVHGMNGLAEHSDIWEGDGYTLFDDEPYVSFPDSNDRLDYFLLPPGSKATQFEISPTGLSDHNAVTIDLETSSVSPDTTPIRPTLEYAEDSAIV